MYVCMYSWVLDRDVMQALLRVKYFVTQLGIRKEFAHRSASDVDAVIEDLTAQEKALRAKKVRCRSGSGSDTRPNTNLRLTICPTAPMFSIDGSIKHNMYVLCGYGACVRTGLSTPPTQSTAVRVCKVQTLRYHRLFSC